jgi:hypothetical protein
MFLTFFLTSLCMNILISCINGTFILVVRGESMMVLSTVKPTCFISKPPPTTKKKKKTNKQKQTN